MVIATDRQLASMVEAVENLGRTLRAAAATNGVADLTPMEIEVMRRVEAAPGCTPTEIARATGILRSNLSPRLRSLEARGFIESRSVESDRRGVQLYPTPAATRNIAQLRENWASLLRDLRWSEDSVLRLEDQLTALDDHVRGFLVRPLD